MAVHLNVGPPGTGNLAYWGKGVLVVFRARGVVLGRELLVEGRAGKGFYGLGGVGP